MAHLQRGSGGGTDLHVLEGLVAGSSAARGVSLPDVVRLEKLGHDEHLHGKRGSSHIATPSAGVRTIRPHAHVHVHKLQIVVGGGWWVVGAGGLLVVVGCWWVFAAARVFEL